MNSRVTGQNQRPRGFKVKHGVQYALILAICIWFLYQINCSHNGVEHYARSLERKLGEEHGAVILGCKVNVGWLTSKGDSESTNVNFVMKSENKEANSRDNELSKIPMEKAKDENFEREKKGSLYEEHQNFLESYLDSSGKNHNVSESDVKKLENGRGRSHTQTKEKKENDEHGFGLESERKKAEFRKNRDNTTATPGQHETEHRKHGFDDENGVPQDINDVTESQV
ncbi:Uncharacterized protein Adt_32823 [Abeliophyllum distichum]|uniref:Uncharacterized protein n=1 Tax=Abeliophyllum distichum TaxID=126358 RepID=A0ABD1QVS6_9LAMI